MSSLLSGVASTGRAFAREALRTRHALRAYARSYEDGITASIFAIALLVLLGMVALGIDGSRIYDERRTAQNAADHAAIAAAFASCTSTSTDAVVVEAAAVAAGLASADENGYDNNGTSNTVNIDVAPGASATDHRYEAHVETTIGATFANIIGFAQLNTNGDAMAEATGCDETGGGVPAIHAGGTDCPSSSLNNVQVSGNDHRVTGVTRTNGNFYISGNDNIFLNPGSPAVEYRGTFSDGSADNTYDGAPFDTNAVEPWPAGYDPDVNMTTAMWNAYKAVRVNSDLNQKEFHITADGVYYTENTSDDIEILSMADGAKFVVVSKHRPVKLAGNQTGKTVWAYDNNPAGTPENVIVVSGFTPTDGKKCDSFAFEFSGERGTYNGIFWTPLAMSRFSGNIGTINGGFVSWAFQMNGNNHTINGGTGIPTTEPDVTLTE